jgi:hypothetical protein
VKSHFCKLSENTGASPVLEAVMKSIAVPLFLTLTSLVAVGQGKAPADKYSWQWKDTSCNYAMTFCWYGPYTDNSDEATAWGNQWVSHDKDEKVLRQVVEIRCLKSLGLCIHARNQNIGSKLMTNIDLYHVREWSDFQIRADMEGSKLPPRCEQDSLLINRADASVVLIASAGADAGKEVCTALFGKPKTVTYELQQ